MWHFYTVQTIIFTLYYFKTVYESHTIASPRFRKKPSAKDHPGLIANAGPSDLAALPYLWPRLSHIFLIFRQVTEPCWPVLGKPTHLSGLDLCFIF
jgi:hypothetical protein